jgi:mRNA interferase HicA
MSYNKMMRGNEFVKRVKKLAKTNGLEARVDQKRGKGSHVTLYYGDKFTIVRNLKDELKTGTLKAMLKQLGIKEDEI